MITGRVEVLGVSVDPVTSADLIDAIAESVARRRTLLIGNHNLHSTYLVRTDAGMRRFYERADLVYVDGMPLVWADRFGSRRLRSEHRATLLDWLDPLMRRASSEGWSVFLLGAGHEVVERTAAQWRQRYRGARIAAHHGYLVDDAVCRSAIDAIGRARPDLMFVGMGMPRQEHWLVGHFDDLDVRVAIAVGGLFDYYAGASATPPRWLGHIGLEWFGRLCADPRRLAHRYLVEPLLLAGLLLRERSS